MKNLLYYGMKKSGFMMILFLPPEVDCILEAVFIVSPKRQYLGIFDPTTPIPSEKELPMAPTQCGKFLKNVP